MRRVALAALIALPCAAFATAASSVFLGASPGTPVAYSLLPLPPVHPRAGLAAQPIAGPFEPSLDELLHGETIITTEAQMKLVWGQLFRAPYAPQLFDFDADFAVLMGAGKLTYESFSISSVERSEGSFGGLFGAESDAFLAVTATVLLPGVPPPYPIPPHFAVSAARVPKSALDDVIFHRTVVAAP